MNEGRRGKKKQLYKLVIGWDDINMAWHALQPLATGKSHVPLYDPLFQAAVIAYARPFSDNDPFGPLPGKWSRFSDPRLQEVHDFLVRGRDEHVAHADAAVREVRIVPAGATTLDGSAAPETTFTILSRWRARWGVERVIETCDDLRRRLLEEAQRLLHELFVGRPGLPRESFKLDTDDDL
jgi:hypothetical protein